MRPKSARVTASGRLLNFLRLYLAPFVLGAGAVLGFAPFGFYPLAPIALALLLLLWRRCGTIKAAAGLGFAFGAGLFLLGVSWVYVSLHIYGGMAAPLAAFCTVLFCLIQAAYPALALALLQYLRARTALTLMVLFPALWTLTEWMRSWLLSGFPWLSLGYSQVPESPLAGYAAVLGVFGVSLATAAVAGAAASAFAACFAQAAQSKRFAGILPGIGAAVLVVLVGAALKTHAWTHPVGEPIRVTLLQGNIPQEMKWRPEHARATLQTYLELVQSASGSTLILLPETALPMLDVDVPPDYLGALAASARRNHGDILYGVPEFDASGKYFNSVMSIGTAPVQRYRKHHLVPFGDYFPLQPVLGWIARLMDIPMSDFSHGPAVQRPLEVAGQRIAVNICYEDAFGEEIVRQLPQATMLANFTNDAWWGDTVASRQHLQIAQARALETGRPMLRATNTGVTAIIDPIGRIVAAAPEFTTTRLSGLVSGYQGVTPYIAWGNAAVLVLALAMLAAALTGPRLMHRIFRARAHLIACRRTPASADR